MENTEEKYRLSKAAELIHGQPMFKVLSKIKEKERQGKDIIHFEIGDPDFKTPDNIISAGCNALKNGITHYADSIGDFELRNVIKEKNVLLRGFEPDLNQILISPGANILIYYAIRCLVNPGDEVILPDPCFATYISVLNFCKVNPVFVPLKEENGFRLRAEDIKRAITSKTRLIIINSPHNPTGAVTEEEELDKIGEIALENKIFLYADEIYSFMNYSDKKIYSPSILDKCKEYIIVADGFSKSFAMTGWRLGYAIAPEDVVDKMRLLLETTSSCVPPFIQKAGVEALTGNFTEIENMIKIYKERRDYLVKELNLINGVSCILPEGAFYVFANIKKTGLTSKEFAFMALEKVGVGLLPGEDFGEAGEGYIRLCYATSMERIEEGIKRLNRLENMYLNRGM